MRFAARPGAEPPPPARTRRRAAQKLLNVAGSLRRCPVCQERAAAASGVCGNCEARLRSAVGALPAAGGPVFWLGAYAGPWARLVRALKYERDRRVALLLGGLLQQRLTTCAFEPTLITHVPASPARLRERGFDQAELLASVVRGRPGPPLLHRAAASRSQGRLSRAEREQNAGASFGARACKGQRVLLVDDVLTTGATTRACAQALLAAGATEVWTAVVARTVRGGP